MIIQLIIGTLLIFTTIVLQVLFIGGAISIPTKNGEWLVRPPYTFKLIISLTVVVLWLVIGISLSAWLWAGLFLCLDIFDTIETSLYFSIVTFTTLGYGDVIVANEWRILASFAAVNGLIIFGLNTAFLVEFTSRLRSAQETQIKKLT